MSAADSPYLGLVPYSEADRDAARFFGRENDIELIASNLRAARLTVLYGQSGVGKTSLLRAGVIHSMRALEARRRGRGRPPQGCVVYFAEWAQAAPAELAAAIRVGAAAALSGDATGLLVGDDPVALIAAAAALTGGPVRLILDQFEEYFRYPEAAVRTEAVLLALLGNDALPLQVLISLREDALHLLDHFKARGLPGLFDNRLALRHLDRAGARLAIEAPVRDWYNREVAPQAPATLEPGLVKAVLDQLAALGDGVATEGAGSGANATFQAPYLQLVMERLWREGLPAGASARTLAPAALDTLGGVKGIVDSHVDTVMQGLRSGLYPIAAEMFDRLVTPSFMKVALSEGDLRSALEDRDSLADELATAGENAAPEHLRGLLDEVLGFLGGAPRVLRSFEDRHGVWRYELYHDALGKPIRAWLGRYERGRRERAATEKTRQQQLRMRELERLNRRRLIWLWMAIGLLVVAVGLGFYAYDQGLDVKATAADLGRKTIELEKLTDQLRGNTVELERSIATQREATTKAQTARQQALGHLAGAQAALVADERQRLLLAAYAQVTYANPQASLVLDRGLALPLPLLARFTHDDTVRVLAFSPDGMRLAGASDDRSARVWDAVSGRELARFTHDRAVTALAFSPDGTRLATGSGDVARVWDVASRRELARLAHDGVVTALAFSPDGTRIVTGSSNKTAWVWDAVSGRELAPLTHDRAVTALAFSLDGAGLATASGNTIRLWDTASGRELARFTHGDTVRAVAFSRDGARLATGSDDRTARVWDVASGHELVIKKHDREVRILAFSPDGTRLATASGNTARLWDATSGRELVPPLTRDFWLTALAFSPDGTRLATASGNTIRLWDTASGRELVRIVHDFWVTTLAFGPDGKRLATASRGTVRVWDAAPGRELVRLLSHGGPVTALAFSPDSNLFATGSADDTARLWDAASGRELVSIALDGAVTALAFSHDGTHLAGAVRDTVRVWDAASGRELIPPLAHDFWVTALAFSPDGTHLATGSGGVAKVWDVASGRELVPIALDGAVTALAFSPDGTRLATASADRSARVWDVASGRELVRVNHDSWVRGLVFSPDGTRLATVSGSTARLWDTASASGSGRELVRFTHDGAIWGLAFSPDGTRVATGSDDRTARVWDAASGRELRRVNHDGAVTMLAFSNDGAYLASGSYDRTARMWDVASGREVMRVSHDNAVMALTFSPDGIHLATAAGNEAFIRYWRPQDLVAQVCSRVDRNLSRREWRQFLGDGEYVAVCPGLPVPEE